MHNDGHCSKSHYNKMKEKIEIHHSNSNKDNNQNKIVDEWIIYEGGKQYCLLTSFFNTTCAR